MQDPASSPIPGDVIQITDKQDQWFGSFMLIEEVHSWGVGAQSPSGSYVRLKLGQFLIVGPAPMVPPHVAEARNAALRTAADVAREAGE